MTDPKFLGSLAVSPSGPIVAGRYGTWILTYTAGRYGIDNGGRLRLLFRYAWDGGTWQTTDPRAENYVTARATRAGVRLQLSWSRRAGRRPWLPALMIDVLDETLAEGDQVILTMGDTSGGSPGHRPQTFAESDFRWLMDIEAFETGTWIEVPDCPVCPVVAAPPARLVAVAPSEVAAGEPFALHIRCVDAFGNPSPEYRGSVTATLEDCASGEARGGLGRRDDIVLSQPGVFQFRVRDDSGWECCSNPVRVLPEVPGPRHYWGDLHAQYNNALGTGSVREAMLYARDVAAVSFAGHQPNDFHFRREGWDEARATLPEFHEPGRFIPLLGYEWSGNTPAGGDHNVHFMGDDGPLHRSSHWHIPDKSDEAADRYPLDELYREFEHRRDVLLIPHVGGRRCDISRYHHRELEPVIEICSCHGRFEWLLHEALENGYTVGVVGGSDDHTGRPGAAYPTGHSFGTRGGLAAIYANELTREGIFAALRARHCYATTGERIGLRVTTADGHMMGDLYDAAEAPVLKIEVAGTEPLEAVEIQRGVSTVYSLPLHEDDPDLNCVELRWSGARLKGRGRHADWSGGATVFGTRILGVKAVAFDHPRQGVTAWNQSSVTWSSTTSGDHDAVQLTLEDGATAEIEVATPIIRLRFRVADLVREPLVRECGGVALRFAARLVPRRLASPLASFTWKDTCPVAGLNVYWIRVTQVDGEMAWSSPIYVNLGSS